MTALMTQIAREMGEDPDRWLNSVWISKGSSMWDFGLDEKQQKKIADFFGIDPGQEANLFDCADEIAGRI